jgi:hypothetical protein
MLKQSTRLFVVLLLGLLMAACAGTVPTTGDAGSTETAAQGGEAAQPAAAAGEKQTLDLWFNSDDAFNQFNEQVIADFEAANPDVDIVYSPYPNEAYKTNLQVAIGSDAPPDIFFNWAGDDTGRYVREGHLLDLTPYAEQFKWGEQLSPAMLDAFSVDGKLYGAPYTQEAKYFYYHNDLFEQLGLAVPTTFDELLAACGVIKEAGMVPLAFGNQERWEGVHYMTIFNQKMAGEDDHRRRLLALQFEPDQLFTDPGYAEAFNQLKAMQDAGCFGDAVNSTTPDAASIQSCQSADRNVLPGHLAHGQPQGERAWKAHTACSACRPSPAKRPRGNQNFVLAGPTALESLQQDPLSRTPPLSSWITTCRSQCRSALLIDTSRLPVRAGRRRQDAGSGGRCGRHRGPGSGRGHGAVARRGAGKHHL